MSESTGRLTRFQLDALERLANAGGSDELNGVPTRTRSTLIERELVAFKYPLYRITAAGHAALIDSGR